MHDAGEIVVAVGIDGPAGLDVVLDEARARAAVLEGPRHRCAHVCGRDGEAFLRAGARPARGPVDEVAEVDFHPCVAVSAVVLVCHA